MPKPFFEKPILNSPYEYPSRHWELDPSGQPTNRIVDTRRIAEFITPIPKPKKRKTPKDQQEIIFDEAKGLSTTKQQYETMSMINSIRQHVDRWRQIPNPVQWDVTPETARLLQHWRHHKFSDIRPFFCQVEAIETVIWLSEVAPRYRRGTGHAYVKVANAPNMSPKTMQNASIREYARETRVCGCLQPFEKIKSGVIATRAFTSLGDDAMSVFWKELRC